jgi:hypothetical protein
MTDLARIVSRAVVVVVAVSALALVAEAKVNSSSSESRRIVQPPEQQEPLPKDTDKKEERDPSATTPSRWAVEDQTNPMGDERVVSVHRQCIDCTPHVGVLYVYRFKNDWAVSMTRHDFPGRHMRIRVDSHQAMTGTGRVANHFPAALLKEMLHGTKLTLEYYEWPDDYPKFATYDLAGFAPLRGTESPAESDSIRSPRIASA